MFAIKHGTANSITNPIPLSANQPCLSLKIMHFKPYKNAIKDKIESGDITFLILFTQGIFVLKNILIEINSNSKSCISPKRYLYNSSCTSSNKMGISLIIILKFHQVHMNQVLTIKKRGGETDL